MKRIIFLIVFINFILLLNCDNKGDKMSQGFESVKSGLNISDKKWKNLIKKKIYFGHMSVGYNIIDGINEILKENKLEGLKIVETNNIDEFNTPIFGHSKIGINTNPKSKIDAFVASMDNGLGNKVDIAFLKLCYVDISLTTNIDELFVYYSSKMNELKKRFPKVKLIHFTVPLTTFKKLNFIDKLKDFIKSIIGRETEKEKHIKNNVKRNMFNALLRKQYKEKDIFDLAKFQSTYPDNKIEIFNYNNIDYQALVPAYSSDGGHLNSNGQIYIASHFLIFLSNL